MKYQFILSSLYLPEKRILVVGDLHLGFEHQLQQAGILLPGLQTKDLIQDLERIIRQIKSQNLSLDKIIFLGDIKHSFGFEYKEKLNFNEVLDFLRQYFKEKNIILIKGNHDTIDYSLGEKMFFYYIEKDVAFIHGHKFFPEAFDKKIKMVIMGHIHPSITFSDSQDIKRENYKCFLVGKFKNKEIVILPSFLNFEEGSSVNEYIDGYEDEFSIISKKALLNFRIFVVGENKIYEFGRVKKMTNQ